MARNGVKTGGRDFKPGNKYGAVKKLTPEQRIMRTMTRQMYADHCVKYMHMTLDELRVIHKRTDIPAIESIIVGAILRDKTVGGTGHLMEMLDNCVGSRLTASHKTELSNPDGTLAPVVNIILPDNGRQKKD